MGNIVYPRYMEAIDIMEVTDDEDDCYEAVVVPSKTNDAQHHKQPVIRDVPIELSDTPSPGSADNNLEELLDSPEIVFTPLSPSAQRVSKKKMNKNRDEIESIIEIDDDDEEDPNNATIPGQSTSLSSPDTTCTTQQLLIYPPTGSGGISISIDDYQCLAKEEFLNDVIIEFYLKYLYTELLTDAQRDRTHIFSTFFYNRLMSGGRFARSARRSKAQGGDDSWTRHERVQKWTKHVNLFEKDFIFVPINEHNHWYLAIVCFPSLAGPVTKFCGNPVLRLPSLVPVRRPCILILDSMETEVGHLDTVVNLQRYLSCEYRAKFSAEIDSNAMPARTFNYATMPGHMIPVPQQDNSSDCGVFVLQFVEEFFLNPIKDFQMPIKKLANWFDCMVVIRKREEIAKLLLNLVRQQHPEREELLPKIEFPTKNGRLT